MKRRNFLAGILPALFAGKAVAEILVEDKPKYVVVHDPCNPKEGEVLVEVIRWRSSDPVSVVGCTEDIFEKCTLVDVKNPSYDPKKGEVWEEVDPIPVGCVPDADLKHYIPNTESLENPSYDKKTGMITYIDPEGFTTRMRYHPLLEGPLPKKYQQ